MNLITLPARLFCMGYYMIYLFIKGLPQIFKTAIINMKYNPYLHGNKKQIFLVTILSIWAVVIESLIIPLCLATIIWFVPMRGAIYMGSFAGFIIFSFLLSPWFYTFHYVTVYMNKMQIWRANKIMAIHLKKQH